MTLPTPVMVAVLVAEVIPAAAFAFAGERVTLLINTWPRRVRIFLPAILVLPYLATALSEHMLRWPWLILYAALPVLIAWLLEQSAIADPQQCGNWRDALILLTLGLAVDLHWFDSAWPHGEQSLGKILLVVAGLYGFLGIRQLTGVGFDFHMKPADWKTGLRELMLFAPFVLVLGLALGFIHPHASSPSLLEMALRWVGIFFFVALPEELFFRGWVQNLMERRMNRTTALVLAALLFGVSHFNKRSAHFNWRYVLLASIAGLFYGRAWREKRHLPASMITHTFVDWIWMWWF